MKMKSIKSLKKRAENLWKEVCLIKYGEFCHVKKHYPHLKIRHSRTIQVDHCISRRNKYFFLDTKNGLPVCASCNLAKNNHLKSVERAIDTIVERRSPQWFEDAVWLDRSGEPNTNFSKRFWLEEVINDLENEKERELKKSH